MKRNIPLDITKGIGILLVILGHFDSIQDIPSGLYTPLRTFIYSFHMPLFFIVSGYLYKARSIKETLKKDIVHLGLPYAITCLVIILFYTIYYSISKNSSLLKYYAIASLFGSGTQHTCLYLSSIPSIGAIWFLPALLICKNIYNLLPTKNRIIYSSFIFLAATVIGRYFIYLPFSALSGLSAIIFYAIGDYLKAIKRISYPFWIIGIICWVISYKLSFVEISQPKLDLYFIDVIGALTATVIIYYISIQISFIPSLMQCFSWLGKNSLYILCIHLIDRNCDLSYRLSILGHIYIRIILSFIIPIAGAFLVSKIVSSYSDNCCENTYPHIS